jgi:hypothetical protein
VEEAFKNLKGDLAIRALRGIAGEVAVYEIP